VLPIETTGLMLGDAIISILCLNEHKKQRIDSDGEQMPQVIENTVKRAVDGPLDPKGGA
jgi:hypothetical protein